MNKQPCNQITEWMSLAQDGLLDRTQMRLLHAHIADCSPCESVWQTMTAVSRLLRQTEMVEPEAGFVSRFEERLAFRAEQRRRALVWLVLGMGTVTLALLALPSILGALRLTGNLVLPYPAITYLQDVVSWLGLVVISLLDAGWLLVRHACTGPGARLCIALTTAMGALVALWTRLLVGRMAHQRTS